VPDIQRFSVTLGGANVNHPFPEVTVRMDVCNSQTGAVIRSFQNGNALTLRQILGTLTAEQRQAWAQEAVMLAIRMTGRLD
jgi:hypothetical protein